MQLLHGIGEAKCGELLLGMHSVTKAFRQAPELMSAASRRMEELDASDDVLGRQQEQIGVMAMSSMAWKRIQGTIILSAAYVTQVRHVQMAALASHAGPSMTCRV